MYYGYTNFNLNRRMSQRRGAIETVIHWIGFTLKPGDPVSEKEVLQLLGMTELICCKSVSGRQGYRNGYFLKGTGITILTDGKSTMETHVDIPGESIATLQNAICTRYQQTEETWLSYFLRLIISNDGAFTRIDLALDDLGGNHFTLDALHRYQQHRQIACRFRSSGWRTQEKSSRVVGSALTFGNRKGVVYVRIYDKQEEEQNNRNVETSIQHPEKTVRWEFEFKKNRACSIAEQLIQADGNVSAVTKSQLKHYFRIVRRDNKNISRCTVLKRWEQFVADAEEMQLATETKKFNVEHQLRYVRNALPAVAAVYQMLGNDIGYLQKLLAEYRPKASQELLEYAGTHQSPEDCQRIKDFLRFRP